MNTETKQERQLVPYETAIQTAKERFLKNSDNMVSYDKESIFAMQALIKNDYALNIANKNPRSVHLAMLNVASTGLTLNPANAYAYLVPRDGAIVLDISYKGLIKIATDAGSIVWARAAVVYEQDQFTYNGPAEKPDHKADVFKADRGAIVGCYCVAKTNEGDILTEVMDWAEIDKIRGKSELYSRKKSGPWVEWLEQMIKKAIIKRASKTWPYTEKGERIAQAIEIANTSEGGYDLETEEEKEFKRQQKHDAALGRWYKSVEIIKEAIAMEPPDLYTVRECWSEISESDQCDLWLATSKGGVFTTHERDVIKTKLPREPQE